MRALATEVTDAVAAAAVAVFPARLGEAAVYGAMAAAERSAEVNQEAKQSAAGGLEAAEDVVAEVAAEVEEVEEVELTEPLRAAHDAHDALARTTADASTETMVLLLHERDSLAARLATAEVSSGDPCDRNTRPHVTASLWSWLGRERG